MGWQNKEFSNSLASLGNMTLWLLEGLFALSASIFPGLLIWNCLQNRFEMNKLHHVVTLSMLALSLGGCASFYTPPQVNPQTGQYLTSTELDQSAIREYETSIDPRKYKFISLQANSNIHPKRFEFFVRNALADLGLKQALNQDELVALVKSHPKLSSLTSINDPLSIKKISETVGPILMVECVSTWDGDVRRYVTLKITDASSGKILLRVEHPKLIWMDADTEAHYPVFNVLRRWFKESTSGKAA